MSLQACADIVAKGDPDRFAAAMAAPVEARKVLFPLYAFNVEVARAPWVSSEPMIGEMRLQWWRDALEEIATGTPVRKHEVTTPLADILSPDMAARLDALVAARRWDLYKDAFEDAAHFNDYLRNTGGVLMWAAAKTLGAPDSAEGRVLSFGTAAALVRFLCAVPDLESRGRIPLVDGRVEAIAQLAKDAMASLSPVDVPKSASPALLEGWQTRVLLAQIVKTPHRVAAGEVGQSAFRKKMSLFLKSL